MDEMTATRCRHTKAWLSIGGPESADAVHNRRRAFRRLLSSHSSLRNPTIFLAGFPPPLSLSLSLSLRSATIIGGNFFPAVPPSIPPLPLALWLWPRPSLSSGDGWCGVFLESEAVPAGGRRMREVTFRFLTGEAPSGGKKLFSRTNARTWVRALDGFRRPQVVERRAERKKRSERERARERERERPG